MNALREMTEQKNVLGDAQYLEAAKTVPAHLKDHERPKDATEEF
jgi:hypothetical protein